jgi:hypothetical protein
MIENFFNFNVLHFVQIRQILGIEKREQEEEIEGSVQFTIRNEMQRIFSFNEQKIQNLIKSKFQTREFNNFTLANLKIQLFCCRSQIASSSSTFERYPIQLSKDVPVLGA